MKSEQRKRDLEIVTSSANRSTLPLPSSRWRLNARKTVSQSSESGKLSQRST